MEDLNQNLQKLKDFLTYIKDNLDDLQEKIEDLKYYAANIEEALDNATEQIDELDDAINDEPELSEEEQQAQAKLEQEAALGRMVMQVFSSMPALQQMFMQWSQMQHDAKSAGGAIGASHD